ncbi:MAG: universal stress protein [Bacteroidales bacterium]|jgi:nucleotide-binding universal stress UspA family protein|nr:universal stress protein [Bacteroidales bacterium]
MESMLKKIILVPTDFSEVCANAINQAAGAAKHLQYKLVVLHVIDKNTKSFLKEEGQGADFVDKQLDDIANNIIADFGIEVDTVAKEGDIFKTISEVATEVDASFMYLGTHGKVGMQKLTGSYALKVVTSSPVPVIVVQKRQFDGPYREIVFPITSDAGIWEKTEWAAHIAKQFKATIKIFQQAGENRDKAVAGITGHFHKNDVKYTIDVAQKSGGFSNQVINFATAKNSDMILIMTNPDKGFSNFLLGSYDEEMIFNTSQIPVMCVNPRDYNWKKIVPY